MTEAQSAVLTLALMFSGEAFYPLTLPLTVGPGEISIAITLGANEPRHLGPNLLMILAASIGCAFLAITIYLC